ncbi:MAG: transposase [Phycisphaerae bacterium]
METEKAAETETKKRWTVEEKARIVRRYLKDHVGLADLAEETGTSPGLILQWAKQALEGLEQTFSGESHRQRKVLHREILEKEDRIRKLESVVSELSTENLTLKKRPGALSQESTSRRKRRGRS